MQLPEMRKEYIADSLSEADMDPDPLRQFQKWFLEATAAKLPEPNAMTLATATPDGQPSARMVLLKAFGDYGFDFFTNYDSRKGRELATNPRAAMLLHWESLGRQVRLEGDVERLAEEDSAAYVRTRPRDSQLSALASRQSRRLENREALEARVRELAARYEGQDLPIPDFWGGFRLIPHSFEFWQHRADRLHDRLLYTRGPGEDWRIDRLFP